MLGCALCSFLHRSKLACTDLVLGLSCRCPLVGLGVFLNCWAPIAGARLSRFFVPLLVLCFLGIRSSAFLAQAAVKLKEDVRHRWRFRGPRSWFFFLLLLVLCRLGMRSAVFLAQAAARQKGDAGHFRHLRVPCRLLRMTLVVPQPKTRMMMQVTSCDMPPPRPLSHFLPIDRFLENRMVCVGDG